MCAHEPGNETTCIHAMIGCVLVTEFCLFTRAVPGEDGGSGSDEEGGRKVTFSYKSDRKAVREGPVDMGATLQLETEPEKQVNCYPRAHKNGWLE